MRQGLDYKRLANRLPKKYSALIVVLVLGYAGVQRGIEIWSERNEPSLGPDLSVFSGSPTLRIQNAFENRVSNFQVEGVGIVEGIRHQKFILRISSNQTLLVAHNIDLARRIEGLKIGDEVGFFGEYEWSEKGGVLHWTHHDPGGKHINGWLQYDGQRYQ